MATISPSPLISEISGTVGGVTFRRSRSGFSAYSYQKKPLKKSSARSAQTEYLSAAAKAWTALDEDIRNAWINLAKYEAIPPAFSRKTKWTGRELFFCFYIYARHQLTPLPRRWLPTPPLFAASFDPYFFFFSSDLSGPGWENTATQFYGYIKEYDQAAERFTYRQNFVFSLWASMPIKHPANTYTALRKIAPLGDLCCQSTTFTFPGNSGYYYQTWQAPILHLMGTPPDLSPEGTSITAWPYSVFFSATALTNERLMYLPPTASPGLLKPHDFLPGPLRHVLPAVTPTPFVLSHATPDIPTTEY